MKRSTKSKFIVRKNGWDTEFFNEKIGSIEYAGSGRLSKEKLSDLLDDSIKRASKKGYKYLVKSGENGHREMKSVLKKKGFKVCDNTVDYKKNLSSKTVKKFDEDTIDDISVGFVENKEIKKLREISERSFRKSRLYKIKFIERTKIDKYHFIWVVNLFKSKDSKVLVLKNKNNIMGFLAFTIDHKDKTSRINLIAIKASFRGRGLGRRLLKNYIKYVYEQGIRTLYVKTQLENTGARKFYKSNGYKEFARETKYHIYL